MNDARDFPFSYARATGMPLVPLHDLVGMSGDRSALIADASAPIVPPYRLWASETLVKPPPRTPGAIYVRALSDCEVYASNLLLRNHALVSPEDTEPFYVQHYMNEGLLENHRRIPPYNSGLRRKEVETAYFVSHFNQNVYGHFLLEIVPKLFHIERLRRAGHDFPVVVSTQSPAWVRSIIETVCPGIGIVDFDPMVEVCRIKTCLLVSNCFALNYFLHPQTAADFRLFALHARRQAPDVPRPSRIFILRDNPKSFRYMTNLAGVRDLCLRHGYVPIDPTDYSWTEQASIFSNAKVVVGEFTSALHNTVFSPPGTAVVCLFWLGMLQEGLCSSLGHRIGYVMPKDNRLLKFNPVRAGRVRHDYELDLDALDRRLTGLTAFGGLDCP